LTLATGIRASWNVIAEPECKRHTKFQT